MRALFVAVAVCLCGCGGTDSLTGNWSVSISSACSGTMSITQTGNSISGTLGCGGQTDGVIGDVSGSSSISLRFTRAGYQDVLMTGTYTAASINGSVNGSGFNGEGFSASKN